VAWLEGLNDQRSELCEKSQFHPKNQRQDQLQPKRGELQKADQLPQERDLHPKKRALPVQRKPNQL
jgi:hypothetical protein